MSDLDQTTSPVPEKEKASVEKTSQKDLKEAEKAKSAGRKKKALKGPKVAVRSKNPGAAWKQKRAQMDQEERERKRKRELAREEREKNRKIERARVNKAIFLTCQILSLF